MRILTIGGATIDTIAIIDSARIERMAMFNAESSFLLLEEGGKTEALEVSTHCGGGAVNAGVAMSRLGFDVSAMVKLGRDHRAETILAQLMEEGVSTRWVLRDQRAPTGCSVLVASHDRNAAIFTFRGANTLFEPGDFPDDAFNVDAVYISNLTSKSAECLPTIIKKAKDHHALVAVNPGLRQISAYSAAFHECLGQIDILSCNHREAAAMVPALAAKAGDGGPALPMGEEVPLVPAVNLSSGGFTMTLPGFFRALTASGPRFVILTDGGRGAFVATKEEIFHCPAAKCKVVGTAGAGDAFASTLTAYLALGRSPGEALRAGTMNAASVIGYVDTQSGLLGLDALEGALADPSQSLAVRRWPL